MRKFLLPLPFIFHLYFTCFSQTIGTFTSVTPGSNDSDFHIPATHTFQMLIEAGDAMDDGNNFPANFDFTGYLGNNGSSTNGVLCLHHELTPGGVSIMDIDFNVLSKKWNISNSELVDFTAVNSISRPCSGTFSPWGTLITCEENLSADLNGDGYNDWGWAMEIDPVSRTLVDQPGDLIGGDKLWAMGNFRHENAAIHSNRRTVYQVADSNPGYLWKFVASTAEDLSSGLLYVFVETILGSGDWILLNNTSQADRNSTLSQSASAGGKVFSGGEDVEIGPDGKIYFAVKNEDVVYRFDDSDPIFGTTVSNLEVFVGGMNYNINDGTNIISEPWGTGNDNLAFDGEGNLWVLQDGSRNYIWVVRNGHTQIVPQVDIFARIPSGAEPTGITFSPDFKYLFMSLQHPSSSNSSSVQQDAFGVDVSFNKDIAMVIALVTDLGPGFLPVELLSFTGQQINGEILLEWETADDENLSHFVLEKSENGTDWADLGNIAKKDPPEDRIYEFEDVNFIEGYNYYRLKVFDTDGVFYYSELILVNYLPPPLFTVTVYPNPASREIFFRIVPGTGEQANVRLLDLSKKVRMSEWFDTNSEQFIRFDLPNLPTGIYLLDVEVGDYVNRQKVLILEDQ